MAQVTAQLSRLRIAPRKVRAVAKLIKGKNVMDARNQLEFLARKISPYLLKLLNSVIANAENNFNMVKENLYIKDLMVNEGMKLKRFRPKGFGRTSTIQKKTSLIKIILDEKVAGLKREKKAMPTKEIKTKTEKEYSESKPGIRKPEIKSELGRKINVLGNIKRLFRRKAI